MQSINNPENVRKRDYHISASSRSNNEREADRGVTSRHNDRRKGDNCRVSDSHSSDSDESDSSYDSRHRRSSRDKRRDSRRRSRKDRSKQRGRRHGNSSSSASSYSSSSDSRSARSDSVSSSNSRRRYSRKYKEKRRHGKSDRKSRYSDGEIDERSKYSKYDQRKRRECLNENSDSDANAERKKKVSYNESRRSSKKRESGEDSDISRKDMGREKDRDRIRDRDYERGDRDKNRDRDRDRNRDKDRDRDYERDRDRNRDRDFERDRDRNRDRDYERDSKRPKGQGRDDHLDNINSKDKGRSRRSVEDEGYKKSKKYGNTKRRRSTSVSSTDSMNKKNEIKRNHRRSSSNGCSRSPTPDKYTKSNVNREDVVTCATLCDRLLSLRNETILNGTQNEKIITQAKDYLCKIIASSDTFVFEDTNGRDLPLSQFTNWFVFNRQRGPSTDALEDVDILKLSESPKIRVDVKKRIFVEVGYKHSYCVDFEVLRSNTSDTENEKLQTQIVLYGAKDDKLIRVYVISDKDNLVLNEKLTFSELRKQKIFSVVVRYLLKKGLKYSLDNKINIETQNTGSGKVEISGPFYYYNFFN